MISIYKYGEVPNSEIYKRENIASNVEGTVAEIIAKSSNRNQQKTKLYIK